MYQTICQVEQVTFNIKPTLIFNQERFLAFATFSEVSTSIVIDTVDAYKDALTAIEQALMDGFQKDGYIFVGGFELEETLDGAYEATSIYTQ